MFIVCLFVCLFVCLCPPTGHGESNDEDHGEGGSSQESGSEEEELEREGKADRECLKWKRGRLLGKGAYGKVWEGLMDSAKMIAVKEVEIDCENPERAQSVCVSV